ncbi:glucohydrolase [Clostridium thermosuccinogenes]|uniref:Glucohydrolase n=1 Tax=Clostridium thermosuccinogenes TaxID=84032 RepID=A0A2K2FNZ9_9CLOT|nr:alpha-glucosidase [Pseudoclostridium thermosuccinogenes]AUS95622.1 glucohydrolase [Pseudoclostridium thermosuccinogenes]PNT98438.1 glucohydrolase [Pseudoclostridium thermosuccinogenes]PNU00506.1 glucohydrolase [Pseudoclostridium thermosuccinogenes]
MEKKWWKEGVVYQIYPRSFKDSNGDGIGDLRGIIEKLDYIKELGADIIWLCPIYQSPNCDNGYDISDYRKIMKEFGTEEDFEELLHEMHKRGLKLIMDLVVNHTSDEHEWFVASKSSRENPYRDYYIWRDGKDGNPPNNWGSFFSGSAWKYDEATNQYYLHLFAEKQPDLNWENKKVREEIYDMMRFWLDKGIDGFRMDVINLISKVPGLPDGEKGEGALYGNGFPYTANGPRVHEYLQEMNREVLSKYDIMTVGETPGVDTESAKLYVNSDRNELNMLFQFELMDIDSGWGGKWDVKPWKLSTFKKIMYKWYEGLKEKGWNSLYLNNHDQPRMVSRFGNDKEYRQESAKMLATLLHTWQGTPYIYQGEEIGMTNVRFEDISEYRDIETLNMYNEKIRQGVPVETIMKSIYAKGRDNARTPMQWDASDNAGFTEGTPWIRVNPNYKEINVENALKDRNSVFYYYQKLIKLRKEHEIIVYGDVNLLMEDDENIFAYTRSYNDEKLLVILNFFEKEAEFKLDEGMKFDGAELLISNYEVDNPELKNMILRPYEARVYKIHHGL